MYVYLYLNDLVVNWGFHSDFIKPKLQKLIHVHKHTHNPMLS